MIKLSPPLRFDYKEARIALDILEAVIDALIELHTNMSRLYDIHPKPDDDIPF